MGSSSSKKKTETSGDAHAKQLLKEVKSELEAQNEKLSKIENDMKTEYEDQKEGISTDLWFDGITALVTETQAANAMLFAAMEKPILQVKCIYNLILFYEFAQISSINYFDSFLIFYRLFFNIFNFYCIKILKQTLMTTE